MIGFFNKPYPNESFSIKDIRTNLGIATFITLFLIIFQPFGISEWHPDNKILKLLSFGSVSFVCPTIIQFGSSVFLNNAWQDNWKIWKEILAVLGTLVCIAFGNLLLAGYYNLGHFYLSQFVPVLVVTCLVGFFPIAASVAFKYQNFLALNKKTAKEIELELERHTTNRNPEILENEMASRIVFIAENNKDRFELAASHLLYIESSDNYSTIHFVADTKNKKELIRSSLKRLELQITEPSILRCHRSYIVNIANVATIEGNAQGYRIAFKNCERIIPVSRNYGKIILDRLKSLK